jgi:hypothetical protein
LSQVSLRFFVRSLPAQKAQSKGPKGEKKMEAEKATESQESRDVSLSWPFPQTGAKPPDDKQGIYESVEEKETPVREGGEGEEGEEACGCCLGDGCGPQEQKDCDRPRENFVCFVCAWQSSMIASYVRTSIAFSCSMFATGN